MSLFFKSIRGILNVRNLRKILIENRKCLGRIVDEVTMVFLALFFMATCFGADKVNDKTILWAFSSAGNKNPSVQSNLVTSRHELFRVYYRGLENYNHSVFVGTIPKIESELRTKKLVCYPGSSEYQRRREFAYLTSQYIQPSPKLVMKKTSAEKLAGFPSHTVKLRAVLNRKDLKGVIATGRSYGSDIDEALEKAPAALKRRTFETFKDTALQMIEDGTADYTIEYDFIVQDWIKSYSKYADIVTVPLSDVEPTMTQYLACSKTPEGLAVITEADRLIRENIKKPSYWTGVLESVPELEKADFQRRIDKYVLDRTKSPEIIK